MVDTSLLSGVPMVVNVWSHISGSVVLDLYIYSLSTGHRAMILFVFSLQNFLSEIRHWRAHRDTPGPQHGKMTPRPASPRTQLVQRPVVEGAVGCCATWTWRYFFAVSWVRL